MMLHKRILLFFALLSLILSGCGENSGMESFGCLSGLYQGSNTRVFIGCISKQEYAISGNTFYGITYDNVIWTSVAGCNECATLDYDKL
ncbi:MAG: hypothetical protein KTR26_15305 [Flammeovirgaceae bacterium]|nr:hypothetical protein [Flammeovirgaceae bacterium]